MTTRLNNPYHFTHTDLDGFGCAVLLQRAGITSADRTKYVSYNDLNSEIASIPRDSDVILTDLSISTKAMRYLKRFNRVLFIDHHLSSEWIAKTRKNDPKMEVIVDDGFCATALVSKWLQRQGYRTEKRFVDLVNDHDLWLNEMQDSDRLANLASIKRGMFVQYMVNVDVDDALLRNKDEIDKRVEDRQSYVNETRAITSDDTKTCVVFAERYQSYIGDAWIKRGYDPVFIVNMRSARVSVRSKDFNAERCCKLNNGGGHLRAAGFPMSEDMLCTVTKTLMTSVKGSPTPTEEVE